MSVDVNQNNISGTRKSVITLRKAYEDEVKSLSSKADNMRKAGVQPEKIAQTLFDERNMLKQKYLEVTEPALLKKIEQRNIEKYGNKLGPSIEHLRNKGKSWEDIIESAARPGGKDIFNNIDSFRDK